LSACAAPAEEEEEERREVWDEMTFRGFLASAAAGAGVGAGSSAAAGAEAGSASASSSSSSLSGLIIIAAREGMSRAGEALGVDLVEEEALPVLVLPWVAAAEGSTAAGAAGAVEAVAGADAGAGAGEGTHGGAVIAAWGGEGALSSQPAAIQPSAFLIGAESLGPASASATSATPPAAAAEDEEEEEDDDGDAEDGGGAGMPIASKASTAAASLDAATP
jgi:hypothetical protein